MSNFKSNMKVASVTHWLSNTGGGISAVLRDLNLEISEQNIDHKVFGLEDRYWSSDSQSWSANNVFPVKTALFPALGWAPSLKNALDDFDPDIVHTHGIWMATSSQVNRWGKKGKPYVVSPHGMLEPSALKISKFKKFLASVLFERGHLNQASCIHALNEQELMHIRDFGLKAPVAIIANGMRDYQKQPELPLPWPKTFSASSRVILFLGRLHPKKNLHGLIEALAKLKSTSRLNPWKLVISGPIGHDYYRKLLGLVEEHNLGASVYFTGAVYGEAKRAALSHADAFILPSFSEGLPVAVLEAWAYGLPTLMTRHCNLSEAFEVKAAFEIPTTPDQMSTALFNFFSQEDEFRKALGRKSQKIVQENYSWAEISEKYTSLYRWLSGLEEKPEFVID